MSVSLKKKYILLSVTSISRNIFSSILLFIFSIILVNKFGPNINTIYKSIYTIIPYFSLVQGGVLALVISKLYKAFKNNDKNEVIKIMNELRNLYRIIIAFYAIILFFLPIILGFLFYVNSQINFIFISSFAFICILELSLQYIFAYKYVAILQADNKNYIWSSVFLIVTTISNVILIIVAILIEPKVIDNIMTNKNTIPKTYNIFLILLLPTINLVGYWLISIGRVIYGRHTYRWALQYRKIKFKDNSLLKNILPSLVFELLLLVLWNTDLFILNILKIKYTINKVNMIITTFIIYNSFSISITNLFKIFITSAESGLVYTSTFDHKMKLDQKLFFRLFNITITLSIFGFLATYFSLNYLVPLLYNANNYYHYSNFLILLFAIVTFLAIFRQYINIIIVIRNLFKSVYIFNIFETLLNIFGSIVLAYYISIWGVLVSTIFSVLLFNFIYLSKIKNFKMIRFLNLMWLSTILITLASCIVFLVLQKYLQSFSFVMEISLILALSSIILIISDKLDIWIMNRKYY